MFHAVKYCDLWLGAVAHTFIFHNVHDGSHSLIEPSVAISGLIIPYSDIAWGTIASVWKRKAV